MAVAYELPTLKDRRYLASAEVKRADAERIVKDIEEKLIRFRALEVVPLDVLDRLERAIVDCHADNLGRLPFYYEQELTRGER